MIAPDEYVHPPATPADLRPQQLAVASLIARAKPNKQIAAELDISTRQVRNHVEALSYLLHCDRSADIRIQIALWWREYAPVTVTHAA